MPWNMFLAFMMIFTSDPVTKRLLEALEIYNDDFKLVVIVFNTFPQLSASWLLLIVPILGVLTLYLVFRALDSKTASEIQERRGWIEKKKTQFQKNKSEIAKLQNQINQLNK